MNEDQKERLASAVKLLTEIQQEMQMDAGHMPTAASYARSLQEALDILENDL